MGILSDLDIRYMLEPVGGLVIRPEPEIIQPTSVDLRLYSVLNLNSRPGQVVDPARGFTPTTHEVMLDGDSEGFYLTPGGFVNGATLEWIEIPPGLVGILMGKSSLARIGLQIEAAGYVDPGWKGRLTLEIVNLGENTIILRPGMDICQIRFEALFLNACERLYGDPALNSHYQGSLGPVSGQFGVTAPRSEIGVEFSAFDPG